MSCRVSGDIVLVGPMPPPPSGQAVSFAMFADFVQSNYDGVKVIDIASNVDSQSAQGKRFVFRSLEYLQIFLKFLVVIHSRPHRVYITISQSSAGFWRDFIFIMVSRLYGVAVITHLKGGNYKGLFNCANGFKRTLIITMLSRVKSIIVLSETLLETFDFDPGLSDKLKVVKNGFVGPETSPPPNIKTLNTLNVLYLSNLIQSKGYLQLIDAVKLLADQGFKIKLTLAGGLMSSADDVKSEVDFVPSDEVELMGYIGSGYDISYVGTVSGEEKWNLLRQSHLMVLPSKYIYEGQPVSIIEGLAYGLPIVATNYKAIPDMVSDANGVLLQSSSSLEIANAIKIFFDLDVLNDMRQHSFELYRKEFTREYHLRNLFRCVSYD